METDAIAIVPETQDFHEEDFPSILSSDNFPQFHWTWDATNLIIDRCLPPISSVHLQTCANVLTTLTFWDMTTFENLQACLKNLPKLKKLCFSNVLIDEYKMPSSDQTIELPCLQELNFFSHCKVTKDDYWVLGFLLKAVECQNLKKFTFCAEQDVGLSEQRQENAVFEAFSTPECTSLVASFMLQYSKTLKEVLVGGHGVKLCPEHENVDKLDLSPVQLSAIYFQLDVPGINALLKCQRSLINLTCEDFCHIRSRPADEGQIFGSICNCITRNHETLTCIDISPILVTEKLSPTLQEALVINCKYFQDCHSLKTLCLRVCLMENFISFAHSTQGRVINLHLLPCSLAEIEVNSIECKNEEIQMLGERMGDFIKLRRLSVACPASNSFVVNFTWIPSLETLTPHNVNFYSARMSEEDQVKALDYLSRNGVRSRLAMAINNRGVFFRC